LQEDTPQYQDVRKPLDKTGITDWVENLAVRLFYDIVGVVYLEIAILRLMDVDQSGYDFTDTQISLPLLLHRTIMSQHLLLLDRETR